MKASAATTVAVDFGFRLRVASPLPEKRVPASLIPFHSPSSSPRLLPFAPLTLICKSQTRGDGDGNGIGGGVVTKRTRRRRRSSKISDGKKSPRENAVPVRTDGVSANALSTLNGIKKEDCRDGSQLSVPALYQNGDPLGKRELGRCVIRWIMQGMKSMAADFVGAEVRGEFSEVVRRRMGLLRNDSGDGNIPSGAGGGNLVFVIQAQPFLNAVPMPKGVEALCLKACTHYPTLFDHFQRELRDALQELQRSGVISNWRDTESWKLLKELANSVPHRAVVRKGSRSKCVHSGLGMELDKAKIIQRNIDNFVNQMSNLLRIERDSELEYTQKELNAVSTPDKDSDSVKPIDFIISHGQSQQEQCDTICNLMDCVKIDTLVCGEIDCADFRSKLLSNTDKPAIINVNIGTTVKGAVDDLDLVIKTLEETGFKDRFYIHCDGALFGLMMPFVKRAPKVSFKKPIGSVSVSGHKFVGCPMPCGVQITRLKHVNALSSNVEYLASRDATIMGSRNGHAPIFLWYTLNRKGYTGFQKEVQKCLRNAYYLKERLRGAGISAMLNELSSTVVFERPKDEEFVRHWQLACEGNIAHVVVMPSVNIEKLDFFVNELVEKRAGWYQDGKVPCIQGDIGKDNCACVLHSKAR